MWIFWVMRKFDRSARKYATFEDPFVRLGSIMTSITIIDRYIPNRLYSNSE